MSRNDIRLLSTARRLVSSSRASGSTPSASSSWRYSRTQSVMMSVRDLGMELQPEAPTHHEGLWANVRLGHQGRSGRKRERVEVPLEPRSFRHQLGVGALYREPADLRVGRAIHLAAEDAREHLTAEAETEHRNLRVHRSSQQARLAGDERLRVVERRELRPQRHDEVVAGRIHLAVVDVDPERLDAHAVATEPLRDEARRRGLLVLEDQGPHRGGRRIGRGHRGPPLVDRIESSRSTSSAT